MMITTPNSPTVARCPIMPCKNAVSLMVGGNESVLRRSRQLGVKSTPIAISAKSGAIELTQRRFGGKIGSRICIEPPAEIDPQNLGSPVPRLELCALQSESHETNNLASEAQYQTQRDRLIHALRDWVNSTNDPAVTH